MVDIFVRGELIPLLAHDLKLKEAYRSTVRELKGSLVDKLSDVGHRMLVSIGDRVTKELLARGVRPDICVVDLKEQRNKVEYLGGSLRALDLYKVKVCNNPPGLITREAWKCFLESVILAMSETKVLLIVNGEEDLLGYPAALLLPAGSIFVYGQPGLGMVKVSITPDVRMKAFRELLEYFTPID